MKKRIITIITATLFSAAILISGKIFANTKVMANMYPVPIDEEHFKDSGLRQLLIDEVDTDADGKISLLEANDADTLYVDGNYYDIKDLS